MSDEDGLQRALEQYYGRTISADDLRCAAAIGAARERELIAVLGALAAAGLRPILIKGGALAYTHYPHPELRPRDDTDMMIPRESRDAAARALAALGYQRAAEVDGELITAQFHLDKRDAAGILHALDVHWRVSNARAFADALSYDELARDAVAIHSLGPHAYGASARHSLLLACVHRVAHHADTLNLMRLHDIHLLARDTDRDAFVALASQRRMRAVCARGLALASAEFGGIDPRWIADLSDANGPSAAEPSAAFLGSELSQAEILRSDLAATPGWRGRARIIKEHLFPSRAFMYQRYGTRQPAVLPFLYVHRIVTGAPRWLRP